MADSGALGGGTAGHQIRLETLEDLGSLILFSTQKKSLDDLKEADLTAIEKEICRFRCANKKHIKRSYSGTLRLVRSWVFKLDSLMTENAYHHFPYDFSVDEKAQAVIEQITNELFDFNSCGQLVQKACQNNSVYLLEEIFSKIDLPLTYLDEALKLVSNDRIQVVSLLLEVGAGVQVNPASVKVSKQERRIPFVVAEGSAAVLRDSR